MKKDNGGKRCGKSGRKTCVVALVTAGALAVTCLGGWGVPQLQGAFAQGGASTEVAAVQGKDGPNASKGTQTVRIGHPVTIKGDEGQLYDWSGKADFTVVSAKQYASIDDAPVVGKRAKGFVNRGIAHEYEAEGGSFVLVKVKVRNVSAEFSDGGLLSTMFEPADVTAADPVYLNCKDSRAINPKKPEYLSIDKGKTATFEIGWSVIGKGQVDRIDFGSEEAVFCEL